MKALATIERDWELTSIYGEARRICEAAGRDDQESLTTVEMSLRCRAFRQRIEPFMKTKASLHALQMPAPIILHPDGKIETVRRPLTDDERKIIGICNELIVDAAKHYKLNWEALERELKKELGPEVPVKEQ